VSSRSLSDYTGQLEGHGSSVPELLGRLATESSHLIRDEIALAKREISDKAILIRRALVWAAVSALLGLAAVLALCAAVAAALAPLMGVWQALLVVAGGLILVSAGVAYVSAGIVKRTTLAPEQTIDTLEENKEWLKDLT